MAALTDHIRPKAMNFINSATIRIAKQYGYELVEVSSLKEAYKKFTAVAKKCLGSKIESYPNGNHGLDKDKCKCLKECIAIWIEPQLHALSTESKAFQLGFLIFGGSERGYTCSSENLNQTLIDNIHLRDDFIKSHLKRARMISPRSVQLIPSSVQIKPEEGAGVIDTNLYLIPLHLCR